jgi:hypothetical protein
MTELSLRRELAAVYHLVAHFRMTDLIFTHISVRLPGPEQHFLINPYGLLFEEITASNLVKNSQARTTARTSRTTRHTTSAGRHCSDWSNASPPTAGTDPSIRSEQAVSPEPSVRRKRYCGAVTLFRTMSPSPNDGSRSHAAHDRLRQEPVVQLAHLSDLRLCGGDEAVTC